MTENEHAQIMEAWEALAWVEHEYALAFARAVSHTYDRNLNDTALKAAATLETADLAERVVKTRIAYERLAGVFNLGVQEAVRGAHERFDVPHYTIIPTSERS